MKLQGLAPPGEHQGADGADGDAAVVVWSPLTGLPLVPPPVLPLAPPLGLALDPLTGLAEEPQLGLALEPRLELPPGTPALGRARELMTWLAKAPPIVSLLIAPPPGTGAGAADSADLWVADGAGEGAAARVAVGAAAGTGAGAADRACAWEADGAGKGADAPAAAGAAAGTGAGASARSGPGAAADGTTDSPTTRTGVDAVGAWAVDWVGKRAAARAAAGAAAKIGAGAADDGATAGAASETGAGDTNGAGKEAAGGAVKNVAARAAAGADSGACTGVADSDCAGATDGPFLLDHVCLTSRMGGGLKARAAACIISSHDPRYHFLATVLHRCRSLRLTMAMAATTIRDEDGAGDSLA